ncbi:response regulator receiver protein [Marinobacter lipolyticus SM19]|uniref:Response regulator receiver protein n=1 Tax=Marinobacter lipolyticus SM19 TaxID=1318628 RepID=R8B6A1_9GAMM|nr:fused response regulator/phosphatase [Marinobacter lipolyticus]EON94044.1 response regulator receiver protein [Marinobacter lipolyticus SM19]
MDDSQTGNRSLLILIADDSDSDRLILKTLLRRLGHDVLDAANGVEAVELFRQASPQLVFLDAMMPQMDGMEAARKIKALAGERLVPLIFLTSLTNADALARCLEAGGDDFLTKPYNRVIIEAKINAFNRMRLMHQTISEHRDLIHERNRKLTEEQHIAKRVFDNIAHTGCLDTDSIRYHASPLSIFNGDILFASPSPAGGIQILIGDFTGHGLPAAVGAMPVAEIFYGMTAKGFSGSDVLREINQKLKRILPAGMFCCAAMIQADFALSQVQIWNGGLPDGWLIRQDGSRRSLPSSHLPLGVLDATRFDASMTVIQAHPGDTLMFMTDGVLETTSDQGDMFGDRGVVSTLNALTDGVHIFDAIIDRVRAFSGGRLDQDDLTLVTLDMAASEALGGLSDEVPLSALEGPAEWHCVYEVRDRTLGQFSPLPLLLHICMEVPALRRRSGEIYTLLSELYTNALEHGVLGLPSEWKRTADGFGRYYAERERRLSKVSDHFITFRLTHSMTDSGGQLVIVCEDSGRGFDYQNHPGPADIGRGYAGRGLMLLQRLAGSLTFRERGNHVEIVYDWHFSEAGAPEGEAITQHGGPS